MRDLQEKLNMGPGPDTSEFESEKRGKDRNHTWETQHGFYACMGGYVFDLSDEYVGREPPFLPGAREKHFTVTPFGVVFLMKFYPDLLPDISAGSIQDRSKSDPLGKAIVVLQLLWFILNLVARRASNLPISLLEVSTVAHAISAVTIYLIWWNKPHDVTLPIPIEGTKSGAREACALMSMLGPTCRPVLAGLWTLRCESEYGTALEYWIPENSIPRIDRPPIDSPHSRSVGMQEKGAGSPSDGPPRVLGPASLSMGHGEGKYRFRIIKSNLEIVRPNMLSRWSRLANRRLTLLFGATAEPEPLPPWYTRLLNCQLRGVEPGSLLPWYARPRTSGEEFKVDEVDLERWRLAPKALSDIYSESGQAGIDSLQVWHQEPLLTRHSTTAYSLKYLYSFDRLLRKTDGLLTLMLEIRGTLTVYGALALYGLPHMLAWNARFPTYEEHIAWQASALALLSPIAVISWLIPALIVICLPLLLCFKGYTSMRIAQPIRLLMRISEHSLTYMLLTLYLLACMYLVFESFRQLFFLSEAAYDIASWSEVWPHVS